MVTHQPTDQIIIENRGNAAAGVHRLCDLIAVVVIIFGGRAVGIALLRQPPVGIILEGYILPVAIGLLCQPISPTLVGIVYQGFISSLDRLLQGEIAKGKLVNGGGEGDEPLYPIPSRFLY